MKISKKGIIAVLGTAIAAASTSAFAVLPVSVGTTVTGIQTDGQALFDLIFPVIAVFVGLKIITKLFKRFTSTV